MWHYPCEAGVVAAANSFMAFRLEPCRAARILGLGSPSDSTQT